jgi:hypothetical protein
MKMKGKSKRYTRPHPVVSGQTKPENKELLRQMASAHPVTPSELVGEALEIALPKLLKRYPLPTEAEATA